MPRTILVVDDELMNREILANMLGREYSVITAKSGGEALELIRRQQSIISAVLLDLKMPGMDGFEVLKAVKSDELLRTIPIIVATAMSDFAAEEKAISLGAYGFVTKPYRSVLIKHHLENAISFRESAALHNLMRRDELTKILNMRGFSEQAEALIADRPMGYYVLSCIDVDSFKIINDQYGTQSGDSVLIHIARTLNSTVNELGGICARVGSDDFVVLCPAKHMDSETVKNCHRAIMNPGCISRSVNIRIGRYTVDDITVPVSAMYDRALLARESIKGRYDIYEAVYDNEMRDCLIREQRIVSDMGLALAGREFEVWYQPQCNHSSGARIGAEALVRWRHPEKGLIPPADFIPIFERNGFIYALDKYVWEQVCKNLRTWMDEGRNPLPVSVNISRQDIANDDIVQVLISLIKKYGIPISLLRLEITETAFAGSSELAATVVKQLIAEGFTVEIDDFGSGYSSLNTLKDIPAQIIKLDMKFLESCEDSQRGGNIVESVVRMAKWLGMSVIAEGVEAAEQADFLRSIGCNYLQGYFYARPMPVAEYEEFCKGIGKEEHLITLETVDNLDNNSFWDPNSMDTLIFNSYVGGACIYEYNNGRIELIRATEKYAQVIGSAGMTVEDALKLNWTDHLDEENHRRVMADLDESIATRKEVTGEYVFLDLPGCPHETYLRSSMRVIAAVDGRYLVYCTNENITAQRKAEREMQAAAAQMQTMMDDMPGGFARMSVEQGRPIRPVYVNEGFLKLMGIERKDVAARYDEGSFAGVHPDDIGAVKEFIAKMLHTDEACVAHYRLRNGGGEYVWMAVLGRMTVDASGDTFFNVYYSDATKQVQEEEAQRALLDNLPGGAGIYEFKDGIMSLIYQNKSYWALVGLDGEDYPDPGPMSAIHPDDISIVMQELSGAIRQGRDVACDIRLRHMTKGFCAVRLVGRIIHADNGVLRIYTTFTPNDTNTLSYQQTLPLLLSAIMESTTDLSFAKDREFRYITCSRAFARMVGREHRSDVIGKTDYELFDKEMADKFRRDDNALMESGEAIVDITETIPSADGTPHYSCTSKYILRDGSGEKVGIYGVGRDITRSVAQDTQLRLVNDSVPGGLVTYAYKDDSLKIVYCNDGFCKLFGGTREGFEGRGDFDPLDWVAEEDRAEILAQIKALVDDNVPMDCVFRIHIIGGGFKWVNEKAVAAEQSGDSVLFNAILLDITEQQNVLDQLRISEEESSIAARQGGNLIGRFDTKERTLWIQPEIAAKYSLPETMDNVPESQTRTGVIAPESAEAYTSFFIGIINGSKSSSAVFRHRYTGDWSWTEAKSTTVFSDGGEPVKAIISFADITEKIEREAVYIKWQQSLKGKRPESYTLYRCNISSNSSFDTTEGSLLQIEFKEGRFNFNDRTLEYVDKCVFEDDKQRFTEFLNVDALLANYYQGKRVLMIEYREKQGEGVRWLRLTADLVDTTFSSTVDAYLLFEDINDAKLSELQMKELSETDPLTGILNRTTFAAHVDRLLLSGRPNAQHALLMLDIDGFKQVNDVFGHVAGDTALVDIAKGLRSVLRRGDLVARIGGDEFMVFLADIPEQSIAALKAQQICAVVRKSLSLEVQISGSVGIAMAPRDGRDFAALYKNADSALYHVKGSGKNSYAFYNDDMANEHLTPEPDTVMPGGAVMAEKKRRMLIVDDSMIDHAMLQNIFCNDFIIETAKDGNTALIRLRHYVAAISVVLLDLMMPGMDGFAVMEKMQESAELSSIPVIIVSGDESRDTCLQAIRRGATDFITKPVDAELLRIRVQSAVSRAENERLRAKNSLLEVQNEERIRYESAMECCGVTFVEFNWLTGEFIYYPSISGYLLGKYDSRGFWEILLSDMVADTNTVKAMQQLIHKLAENSTQTSASVTVRLKTPKKEVHNFRMTARKLINGHRFTSRIVIALDDLDYDV